MEDQFFYTILFFLSVELTATSSDYDNDNTQQEQYRKLVFGVWSLSDKGHIVFTSTNYGGKAISSTHCVHIIHEVL